MTPSSAAGDGIIRSRLQKAGYSLIGPSRNAAVKVCSWTKKAITGKGECYKHKFYDIPSWRCLQIAPLWSACDNNCLHCWRETSFLSEEMPSSFDSPTQIIEEAIAAQKHMLNGFPGHTNVDMNRWKEAQTPSQCAISLMGEPTLYPLLSELILEARKRKMTSFVVSNGLHPEVIKKLEKDGALPTQLYVSLNAWDAESFAKNAGNSSPRAWKTFLESIDLLASLKGKTRTVLRMTLARNLNLGHSKEFGKIIARSQCDYCEVKAWMAVGSSRERLGLAAMPSHSEIKQFAAELAKETGYLEVDEHKPSRVVLLCRDKKAAANRIIASQ